MDASLAENIGVEECLDGDEAYNQCAWFLQLMEAGCVDPEIQSIWEAHYASLAVSFHESIAEHFKYTAKEVFALELSEESYLNAKKGKLDENTIKWMRSRFFKSLKSNA